MFPPLFDAPTTRFDPVLQAQPPLQVKHLDEVQIEDTEEFVEESLSLQDKEVEMIRKALRKHQGKRKLAARELGISERTLYRKIKEYGVEE